MTTSMTIPASQAVEPTHFTTEGWENLDQSDVILPRYSIIQPVSRKPEAGKHIGQFQRNIDGQFFSHLDVVILRVDHARIKWTDDLNAKRPDCFSRDGKTGSVYGACNACRFNVQVNLELAKKRAAGETQAHEICNFGYTLLVSDAVGSGEHALLGAMGMSVRPVKVLFSQFIQKKAPPWGAHVRLETAETTNSKGRFYVLQPTVAEWFRADQVSQWKGIAADFQSLVLKDVDEDDDGEAPLPDADAESAGEARF